MPAGTLSATSEDAAELQPSPFSRKIIIAKRWRMSAMWLLFIRMLATVCCPPVLPPVLTIPNTALCSLLGWELRGWLQRQFICIFLSHWLEKGLQGACLTSMWEYVWKNQWYQFVSMKGSSTLEEAKFFMRGQVGGSSIWIHFLLAWSWLLL